MPGQQEKLWDYAAVAPGQEGDPTIVRITGENISRYARLAQNYDPQYHRPGPDGEPGKEIAAMPTMVLAYAPLLRENIAEANGFVALERSKTARRQTPFAKCEIRWFRPVLSEDAITANRRVLEKYERRGSKFVTFRVAAVNQRRETVVEYDYTCIFEYAQGRKEVPQNPGSAHPKLNETGAMDAPEKRPLNFDSISVGDQLAVLTISESQEIINRKSALRLAGEPNESNIHTDQEFARRNIFGGLVNSGPATMSYVDQMLQLSFPLQSFYDGGRLLMRAIEPFRAGDTVTFHGEVTGKGGDAGKRAVACRVRGTNQRGDLVALSDAVLVLPE